MLNEQEVKKIRELMESSQNPIFLHDDDCDGLCAYLTLFRKYKKGKAIAVKVSPQLDTTYSNIINEYGPDLIVILDIPIVKEEFFKSVNAKVLWMDHHPVINTKKFDHEIYYFNPRAHRDDAYFPTTFLAYQVVEEKTWIVLLGCIADYYVPEFYDYYLKLYPDLLKETKNPGEVMYNTKFGELIKIVLFMLKGKVADSKRNIEALKKVESPYEILNKSSDEGKFIYKQAEKMKKEFDELLNKAEKEVTEDKLLLFIYPDTKNSYTAELSNEIFHKHKDKFVIVGREKNDEVKMSFRCNFLNVPKLLEKALVGIKGYGGGHEKASGGAVKREDFDRFLENVKEEIKANSK